MNGTGYENDIQVGIVSYGSPDCPGGERSGVYAEVSFYFPWIESTI